MPAKLTQSVSVGAADAFFLSAYVYDQTEGNPGGVVNTAVAQLFLDGEAISTDYEAVGSGWYRLSASLVDLIGEVEVGVQVQLEKTVAITDLTLKKDTDYSVITTDAYSNLQVTTWDTLCEGSFAGNDCVAEGLAATGSAYVTYQLCAADGSVCEVEGGESWQYWDTDSNTWQIAASTSNANTLAELTTQAMQQFSVANQKLAVKTIFFFEGAYYPTLTELSVGLTTDTLPPETNASEIVMKTAVAGRTLLSQNWTSGPSPYFSWTAGADNEGGSGLRGYCLYLGTDSDGNPATSSGLLGSSPVSTTGTDCGFIVGETAVDFSNLAYRGETWLSSSSLPYYLNIKAVDNAGLVYTGDSAQFEFYFDNTSPANVTYINPAVSSFSNVSEMNYSWPTSGTAASSDDHSGLLGWQYRLNDSSDWRGSETHSDLEIDYIPVDYEQPYYLSQEQDGDDIFIGDNIVYFRTVDLAGNYSPSATYRTGSLSYGGAAPTFIDGAAVTVSPTTSTINSFSLSWPAASPAEGESIQLYYYMVNTTPPGTLATLTGNSATYIPTAGTSVGKGMLAGAQKGSNTVRVVAVDESGNYSPSNVITGTFTLNSTHPDPAQNLTVSDASVKAASLWRASLAWDDPDYRGTGTLTYVVQRSLDGSSWTTVTTTSGTAYVDTVSDSQQYYWRVGTRDASDSSLVSPSYTNAVTLTPKGSYTEAASLTSGPAATEVTTRQAKISWTTNRTSDSRVAFGTASDDYFTEEPSNSNQVTEHIINLNNLSPGTTYYYTAKWVDEDGNAGEADEKSFATAAAPTVTDPQASQVGINSAILEYTTKGASSVKIYYGKTTDFGALREISTSAVETTYTTELAELDDGTRYYYKINTVDAEGYEYEGNTLSFETLPRPRITSVRLQQVANTAQTSILVSWQVNTSVSAIITYYPTGQPELAKDQVEVDLQEGSRQMLISGLLPQKGYTLLVKGRDKVGNEASSDLQYFTTATDTRPPQISNLRVVGGTVPPVGFAAGEIKAQLIVSWDTDEPATSQVEYGEGTGSSYPHRSQEDGNLTMNHTVIISGLTPSKIYHLRAISKDTAGNESRSIDTVTVAPKATQSALDLVVGNLGEFFGFLRRESN